MTDDVQVPDGITPIRAWRLTATATFELPSSVCAGGSAGSSRCAQQRQVIDRDAEDTDNESEDGLDL